MKIFNQFVLKEIKQILSNKKSFLICLIFLIYTPLLNLNATNNILPFDFIVPILFIISGCYPSEFSYSILNSEFDNKTYDIIYVSNINPIIVIISKILFPIILGVCICFSSIYINDLFALYLDNHIYSSFVNLEIMIFIIMSIVFSNIFTVWLLNFSKKNMNKEIYTFSIVINLSIILILYFLFYNGLVYSSILLTAIFITILFFHNYLL